MREQPIIRESIELRRAKVAHLAKYGYIPGDYMMTCPECHETEWDTVKRAPRCRVCADKLYRQDIDDQIKYKNFNVLGMIESVCKIVGNTKADQRDILASGTEELGELAVEVRIAHGLKPGEPGKDGVVGEAVDLMLVAADMIHSELGSLDNDQVKRIIETKLKKWQTKYTKVSKDSATS